MQERLHPIPLTLKQANELVANLHRHHKPEVGHRFSIGCDMREPVPQVPKQLWEVRRSKAS